MNIKVENDLIWFLFTNLEDKNYMEITVVQNKLSTIIYI